MSIHEDVWGSGIMAPPFLNWALDEGQWSASQPSGFIPREKYADTERVGGWLGPRAAPYAVE
jgi:hypothetical protein